MIRILCIFLIVSFYGCSPDLDSSDPDERLRAISILKDESLLAQVALEDKNLSVRQAAILKLSDLKIISQIIVRDKIDFIHQTAVDRFIQLQKLENPTQSSINRVIQYTTNGHIREWAKLLIANAADRKNESLKVPSDDIVNETNQEAKAQLLTQSILRRENPKLEVGDVDLITDKKALVLIATKYGPKQGGVRAVQKIYEDPLLKKIFDKSKHITVMIEALSRMKDQSMIERIYNESEHDQIRNNAILQLNDLKVLFKIIFSEEYKNHPLYSDWVKIEKNLALMQIANPEFLLAMVNQTNDHVLSETGILLLDDQDILKKIALSDPSQKKRMYSLMGIKDDEFLFSIVNTDSDDAVRNNALSLIKDETKILELSKNSFYGKIRQTSLRCLKNKIESAEVLKIHESIHLYVNQLNAEMDSSVLVEQAINGKYDVWRAAAVIRLNDSSFLVKVGSQSDYYDVLRIVLSKLEDRDDLLKIAKATQIKSMRFATEQKSGSRSWSEIFKSSYENPKDLGEALEAVTLFDEITPEAIKGVQQASLNMIRRGDESRIKEMIDILNTSGDRTLAEDFYNCGQPDLKRGAKAWASARGLTFQSNDAYSGSARAGWGSQKNQ